MKHLDLKDNWFKFITSEKILIILEEYIEYAPINKHKEKTSTFNRLDLKMLGSQPIMHQNLPATGPSVPKKKTQRQNGEKEKKKNKQRWRLVRGVELLPEKWVLFSGWKYGQVRIMLANLVDASI